MSYRRMREKEEARLRAAGVIDEYKREQDPYPPTNRTLEHFFRGAWTYHIHNQVFSLSIFILSIDDDHETHNGW